MTTTTKSTIEEVIMDAFIALGDRLRRLKADSTTTGSHIHTGSKTSTHPKRGLNSDRSTGVMAIARSKKTITNADVKHLFADMKMCNNYLSGLTRSGYLKKVERGVYAAA